MALKGIAQISLDLKLDIKPILRDLIDYREQEKCRGIIKRLNEWVANPQHGKLPEEVIALPLPVMIKLIPWLDGREDQLVSKYRDLIQAGKIKGSRSFNRAFAWFELKRNGVISLTISAKSKEDSKSEGELNPILARYMVGAATHRGGLSIDTFKLGFTNARFLLSRAQAAEKVRQLYPEVGERRIIQESLIMLAAISHALREEIARQRGERVKKINKTVRILKSCRVF